MNELIKALAHFRANASIDKTGINTYHNNSPYHTIDDLMKGLQNSADSGLGFTQTFDGNDLITTIVHLESGEQMQSRIYIGDYNEAQKWAGAVTYKRRIALVTMFGLSEPDADGNQTIGTKTPQSKNNQPSVAATDFDFSGPPYRVLKSDGGVKATFSDLKTWGAAMKQAMRLDDSNNIGAVNKPEIERIRAEVESDAQLTTRLRSGLLKSIEGLLATIDGEPNV